MLAKKKMLVPLNVPAKPAKALGAGDALLHWTGRAIIISAKICFGWLGRLLDQRHYRSFAAGVRFYLSFLFEDYGAQIIPNEKWGPSRDATVVTVAVQAVRMRFSLFRGELHVAVSSEFTPGHWEDFLLITDGIGPWSLEKRSSREFRLETFAPILRQDLPVLLQSMSRDQAEGTMNRAIERNNQSIDTYADELRKSGIKPKIYY